MKVQELKELKHEELYLKLIDFKEEYFNLRFQHGTGQLEKSSALKVIKRNIARVKTVINEKFNKNKKG